MLPESKWNEMKCHCNAKPIHLCGWFVISGWCSSKANHPANPSLLAVERVCRYRGRTVRIRSYMCIVGSSPNRNRVRLSSTCISLHIVYVSLHAQDFTRSHLDRSCYIRDARWGNTSPRAAYSDPLFPIAICNPFVIESPSGTASRRCLSLIHVLVCIKKTNLQSTLYT